MKFSFAFTSPILVLSYLTTGILAFTVCSPPTSPHVENPCEIDVNSPEFVATPAPTGTYEPRWRRSAILQIALSNQYPFFATLCDNHRSILNYPDGRTFGFAFGPTQSCTVY